MREEDVVRLDAWVHGRVQGVGFRWWTRCRALELGVVGSATNKRDGRVHVVAEGSRVQCDRLVELLRSGQTPGHVDVVVENYSVPRGLPPGFYER